MKNIKWMHQQGRYNIILLKTEIQIKFFNGGAGPIEGWMKILPAISESESVFSYYRFDVAGSDKPKENQDGINIVNI
ncbi:hypothetical protein [Peribacillus frigoritolerans]|uniref:hypothetical protein n=1 Tax=Peribacillus frigoritolerans TaxID=450367 RepID=UPI0032E52E3B